MGTRCLRWCPDDDCSVHLRRSESRRICRSDTNLHRSTFTDASRVGWRCHPLSDAHDDGGEYHCNCTDEHQADARIFQYCARRLRANWGGRGKSGRPKRRNALPACLLHYEHRRVRRGDSGENVGRRTSDALRLRRARVPETDNGTVSHRDAIIAGRVSTNSRVCWEVLPLQIRRAGWTPLAGGYRCRQHSDFGVLLPAGCRHDVYA